MKKTYIKLLAIAALFPAFALVSCETAGQGAKKGAIYGAGAGVLKGALDNKEGNVLKSGAIGAGVGAAAGAAVGAHRDRNNNDYY